MDIKDAMDEMKKRGWDVFEVESDSMIHIRLPLKQMNKRTYNKITKDLNAIGWSGSWGCVGDMT
jgi:hypothetical protein